MLAHSVQTPLSGYIPLPFVGESHNQGMRETMEDLGCHLLCNGDRVFCLFLFDGHGGYECVERVSQLLPEFYKSLVVSNLIEKAYEEPLLTKSVTESIVRSYAATDHVLRLEEILEGGCTACSILFDRTTRQLFVANVGDTRAVLCRADGTAVRLTYDHKGADAIEVARVNRIRSPEELQSLTAKGGVNFFAKGLIVGDRVFGVLAVTRALGDHVLKPQSDTAPEMSTVVSCVPDITRTTVSDSDKFLICACDGVWDVLSDQDACNIVNEVIEVTRGSMPMANVTKIASQCLVEEALARGSTDNISVFVSFFPDTLLYRAFA